MVHTDGGRRRGKSRPRILYWFRTPPGVRVGRSALDESAIRLIEEHNPDVEFDWTRILKGQDAPVEQKASTQQDRRARPRPRDFAPRPTPVAVKPAGGPGPAADPVRQASDPPPAPAPPRELFESAAESPGVLENPSRSPDDAVAPAGHDSAVDPKDEKGLDDDLPGRVAAEALDTPEELPPNTPAEARLGSEGLSRLRARHAEVLARISEAVVDPVRREELKSNADRLNPDTWVTDAEVTQGLESYETVFESLRTVVGRRARRRRRSGQKPHTGSGGTPPVDPPPNPAADDSDSDADENGEDR